MFQSSVLKSFSQDESLVALRWAEYQKYLVKVDYIKTVKEEKFQTEFLQLIFENCLGYILDSSNPSNFNLEREKKNETDGKKTDGVIYVDELHIFDLESKYQIKFIEKADLMLELNKKLQETKQNFHNELNLEKLTKKLQSFEELEFDDFVKEYAKATKLKFKDKLEERNFGNNRKTLFENDKKEVLEIQNQINKTDKEIDQMVYKLYDLTQDENKIVEGVK